MEILACATRIYFVGIKGVAMAALAIYCKEKGIKVAGSDVADEFPTDEELKKVNISVFTGFDGAHVAGKRKPDAVIFTGAHGGRDNPEVVAAAASGIPVFAHGQALGMIMQGKRQIVVAGSHGKTTTSAMIATILQSAKLDPSYAIGCGGITGVAAAGHFGKSDWFVAEGDEYVTDPGHDQTPRFLWTKPEILVVTNIDFDHPDVYADIKAVETAFVKLQQQQADQQLTVVNCDDQQSHVLMDGKNVVTFGFSPRADVRITHVAEGEQRMFFELEQHGIRLGEFVLKVPGNHNVANATAAIIATRAIGVNIADIRRGLLAFGGTKRRFEKIGESGTVLFYDDYAHHPHEIEATLAGAKRWYPDRNIIVVFQPHTYSRTKALLSEFSRAFSSAHTVILTEIYASAREHETLGVDGETLVSQTAKHHGHVYFAKDQEAVRALLHRIAGERDVVVFMGAGDIYTWGREIVARW